MRLLILNVHFSPATYGGATVVAEEVAQALRRDHGVQVFVISAVSRGDLVPYAVMRVESLGMVHYMINLPHGLGALMSESNPHVAERVAGLVASIAPDLAHVHCIQELGAGCITALQAAGVPVILSVHDHWWLCERQFMMRPNGRFCGQDPIRIEACRGCVDDISRSRRRMASLGAIAARCDRITYPSAYAMDLSLRSGLGHAAQSVIWTNGVRLPGPDFSVAQARHRAKQGKLVFAHVGGPSDSKGWPVIKAAFTAIDRDGFELRLVNGSPWSNWWDGHDLTGLRGDVQVVPRFAQGQIDDFYAEVDCLLFLSQWKETFGLTIREAISRGVRLIQTDSGGTVEHALADPARLLPIGAPASRLVSELTRVLDTPRDHPAPVAVLSYSDQARSFMELAAQVLAERGRKGHSRKSSAVRLPGAMPISVT